jgi:hypothetical protein
VTIVGGNCFLNCANLKFVTFGNDSELTRLESGAFADSSIEAIHIPNKVIQIEHKCFSNCKALRSVTIDRNPRLTIRTGGFSGTQHRELEDK